MPDPNPGMRDGMIGMFELRFRDLADELTSGKMDLSAWQSAMKDELRTLNGLEVIAGSGGDTSSISADMRMQLGLEMQKQYEFLSQFAGQIANGDLTTAQIIARGAQYANPSKIMFWKQVNRDYELPAQPGEGTFCRCGCSWRIVDNDDGSVDAYWVRSLDNSCEICKQREEDWNPYHIDAENVIAEAA